MKKFIFLIIAWCSIANAQTSTTSNSTTNANSNAQNAGNSQAISFVTNGSSDVTYRGDYTVRNVPSMNGPNLTSGLDTCMGSNSGSVAVAGFGTSFGGTYVDENCKRIKLSRELWNMGLKSASIAMLCNDPEVRQALEDTDFNCPIKRKEQEK